jgi:RNA polymerase sigma-70 factor (ECF subfamily)
MENEAEGHLEEETLLENSMAALEKCIEKLVGDQQWCIRLFYLNEKCYKEVAEETGFDLNRVKSYIQNGKRNLKICMEENVG